MKHLDLFSGIGGFAYALDRVAEVEHVFCDNDLFCQEVLKKHWPQSKIYGDIRTITDETADLVTGGFPCQPFSQAGRRRGTEDDRYLWPEMFRVIQLAKPTWVIAENVGGLITWNEGMVLEQVCSDLEAEGYEVQPLIIPACAKNAPHRRDRVWIIGYSQRNGHNGTQDTKGNLEGSNSDQKRQDKVRQPQRTDSLRGNFTEWDKNWFEVATRVCRVDDGLPRRLDRNPRIKALGNAIVPQVAEEIIKRMF